MFEFEAVLAAALKERSAQNAARPEPLAAASAESARSDAASIARRRVDLVGVTDVEIDWDTFQDFCATRIDPEAQAPNTDAQVAASGSARSVQTASSIENIASMLPGPELVRLLADLSPDPDGAASAVVDDPYAAIEMVAAWERVAAWAKAQAALAAACAAELPELNPAWPATAKDVAVRCVAGEELAMRLGCSRMAARELISLGQAFQGPLWPTGDAMSRGEIDLPKVRAILKHLEDAPGQTARHVQEVVLPGAPTRTPSQLSGDLQRALIAVDPDEAEVRRQRAVETRRVSRPRVLPDGMAGIWAVLPAPQAVRIDSGLDDLARSLRSNGDSRTLDQLRSDIFANTLAHQLLLDATPVSSHPVPSPPATSSPVPSSPVPSTQVGTQSPASSSAARGNTARGRGGARVVVNVTVPLSTLFGADDQPGELAGYGAITAHAARELAAEGVWRRIITDPLTGSALDVGRTRYSPPASLADHIRQRDQVCARPGCSARAASCDLDHTIEFTRHDGTTSHTNLGPLCPRDHQIKTDGGFKLTQPEPGVFDWRTPTGHTYRVWPGDHGRYEMTSSKSPSGPMRRSPESGEVGGSEEVHGSEPAEAAEEDPPPF